MKAVNRDSILLVLLSFSTLLCSGLPGIAQVGPAEIVNPELKAAEQAYLPRIMAISRAVAGMHFPFAFVPSRYAGLDPKDQAGADARGLEFVHFQGRLILKLTGNYNAAYSAELLTSNQRADRVFTEVVSPLLHLFQQNFTKDDRFDAFGFEIAYHTRTHSRGFDYEGKEILVVVMDKEDALAFPDSQFKEQEVINRSGVFLNGKPFGLSLGARNPFDVEALVRSLRIPQSGDSRTEPAARAAESPTRGEGNQGLRPIIFRDQRVQVPAPQAASLDPPISKTAVVSTPPSGLDPEALQRKFQPQLDDLAKDGTAKYHFVDYAPPSFVVVRNQMAIQLTVKNPAGFDKDATSIYKRAAQSFDLFLAPQLKPILDKIPVSPELSELDVTVIDQLAAKAGSGSEAVEFIFPIKALRSFVDAEITNQDLINQSLVLVNGVRIALNLQLVE